MAVDEHFIKSIKKVLTYQISVKTRMDSFDKGVHSKKTKLHWEE